MVAPKLFCASNQLIFESIIISMLILTSLPLPGLKYRLQSQDQECLQKPEQVAQSGRIPVVFPLHIHPQSFMLISIKDELHFRLGFLDKSSTKSYRNHLSELKK